MLHVCSGQYSLNFVAKGGRVLATVLYEFSYAEEMHQHGYESRLLFRQFRP